MTVEMPNRKSLEGGVDVGYAGPYGKGCLMLIAEGEGGFVNRIYLVPEALNSLLLYVKELDATAK